MIWLASSKTTTSKVLGSSTSPCTATTSASITRGRKANADTVGAHWDFDGQLGRYRVEVVATVDGDRIVAVRRGRLLATSFHPEITGDARFNEVFLDDVTVSRRHAVLVKRDDGYYIDDVFPDGPMRNRDGVQRGSVADMPLYPGDPSTCAGSIARHSLATTD